MKKLPVPAKKKRPTERIMRAHSVMQDIVAATNKPIKGPGVKKRTKL
jgi:hypothetical protein